MKINLFIHLVIVNIYIKMIEYTLAKQLKDAGYPEVEVHEKCCPECLTEEVTHQPNLSELIHAIGINTFEYLLYDGRWKAKGCATNEVVGEDFESPESVVARLWLKLHRK